MILYGFHIFTLMQIRIQLSTFMQMRIWIQFPKIMRIRIRNAANYYKNYNLATQAKEWLTQCTVSTENTYKKVGSNLNNAGVRREYALLSPYLRQGDQGAKLFILSGSGGGRYKVGLPL
jgi:hypothetical protein